MDVTLKTLAVPNLDKHPNGASVRVPPASFCTFGDDYAGDATANRR